MKFIFTCGGTAGHINPAVSAAQRLRELMPDMIILVETDEDQILMRRLSDDTRIRDKEGARAIAEHQQFNRSIAAAYSMVTGCTIKIITNPDHLLEHSAAEMADVLR